MLLDSRALIELKGKVNKKYLKLQPNSTTSKIISYADNMVKILAWTQENSLQPQLNLN